MNIVQTAKTPEMLKFVPNHLETKKLWQHTIKKFPFVIRYVSDWSKTQQMCDKAILENDGTLESAPDQCKTQCVIKLLIIRFHLNSSLIAIKLKKCLTMLSVLTLLQYELRL